jgi:hypothetical protein
MIVKGGKTVDQMFVAKGMWVTFWLQFSWETLAMKFNDVVSCKIFTVPPLDSCFTVRSFTMHAVITMLNVPHSILRAGTCQKT